MPDFDFLSDLDSNKPDDSKKPDDAAPAAEKNEKFDVDLSFLDEPKTESEKVAEAMSAEADLFGEAVGPVAGDSAGISAGLESSLADDPLADALSELDIEASPAATHEPTPEMSADTTGALSEDAFADFLVGDDKPATPDASMPEVSAAGGDAEILDFGTPSETAAASEPIDEIAPLQSDSTFRWEDRDADEPLEHGFGPAADFGVSTQETAVGIPAAEQPTHDEVKSDPAEIAAIVGGALGVAMVAPEVMAPPAPAWEPPTIVEEPLPPAPDVEDPAYPAYEQLTQHFRQTSLLGGIEAVLGWDERCMMPAAGTDTRAEQITLMSGLIHERLTDTRIGGWLDNLKDSPLAADPHGEAGTTIRQIRRQYEKRSKLPKSLVEELAHTAVVGQAKWQEARQNNDFAAFAPVLEKMVRLKREQADALGYAETPYDALLDEFEQGEQTSRVTQVLGALRDELVPLVAQIRDSGRSPRVEILERRYPVELQRAFGRKAADQIGFDFQRGRLDVTAHPFCTGLGPNDCRITTRYDENFFNSGFFGILHEAGHGIYDQGLRADQYGLPLGEAVSMAIHESQSRMWEIMVGRSLPYWRGQYASARRTFHEALAGVTLGNFYFAVNDVRPSLIRVEADEFTYNLHILIRFELEQALINGELAVADLPAAWNEKYKSYLGIDVPNDADGVLQDIHWSAGLFGYFPTYSLGNLYAAQFFEQADKDLGGLAQQFERGEFQYLKRWLNVNIHRHGQRYTAAELAERITGAPLSHEPLMRHLRAKYDLLYSPQAETFVELDVPDADAMGTSVIDEPQGGVAMHDVGDVGGYGLATEPGFDGMAVGGGMAASASTTYKPTRIKQKPKASAAGMIIVFGGIIIGGILGIALGLYILMWIKGPEQGDILKVRDKLPAWMIPAGPASETPASTSGADASTNGGPQSPDNSGAPAVNP